MSQSSLSLSLSHKQTSELEQKRIIRSARAESSSSQEKKEIGLIIGNRIPRKFFWTSGIGESDITIHAGSYHLALIDAGIERYNVMIYSSIMPAMAVETEKPKYGDIVHGSVLESIMAVANGKKGERVTAAITYGWLFNKKTGEKHGGLVAEYNGHDEEEVARESVTQSLNEMYENGFSENFELRDVKMQLRSFIPKKKFGTALVAIGFKEYIFPIVG